jgi:2-keto-4-pentenoate hydratase
VRQRIEQRADHLFNAHRDGLPFKSFAGQDRIDTITEAYAIQNAYVERLVASTGNAIVGYKVGLTSPRMQALLGIDSPIAGAVLKNRVLTSGVAVSCADFGQLGMECEIAVLMGRDLAPSRAPFSAEDVAAAVDAVCPAFEVVDDRCADYGETDIYSLVADNSWNAGVVLGSWSDEWPELAGLEGVLFRNGDVLDRGRGEDVLGHPFNALTWLANHLASGPRGLCAGDVIATGSMVPTRMPLEPETCLFRIEGLGEVEINVVD